MQTRTIIDRIEIEPQTGNVGVRMRKQVITDDGTLIANDYHRTVIDAGADPAAQMAAVNAHLATMGFPAAKSEDVAVLNAAVTPLASHRAAKAREARVKAPDK
jgi:hypothetical protein